jgi:hypothetical protein
MQKADEPKKTAAEILNHAARSVEAPMENLSSAIDAGKKAYLEATTGSAGEAT